MDMATSLLGQASCRPRSVARRQAEGRVIFLPRTSDLLRALRLLRTPYLATRGYAALHRVGCYSMSTMPDSDPAMTPVPTFSIEERHGNVWMVVESKGKREMFPAGTRMHAQVMIGLEKNRLAGKQPR